MRARPKILKRAWDIDGCLLSDDFYELAPAAGNVIKCHEPLFKFLNKLTFARHFDEVLEDIASTRQSKFLDDCNIAEKNTLCQKLELPGNGVSCFEVIKEVSLHLDSQIHVVSLADICNYLEPGTTFRMATSNALLDDVFYPSLPSLDHMKGLQYDKSKIVYAQIHQLSLERPNSDITYELFDDQKGVVATLQRYFKQNPSKIPGNVSIDLYHYCKSDNIFAKCQTITNPNKEQKADPAFAERILKGDILAKKVKEFTEKPMSIKLDTSTPVINTFRFYLPAESKVEKDECSVATSTLVKK